MNQTKRRGMLEHVLSLFSDVRGGEAGTALLLMLNVFLLLTCYYIIKPVREALILNHPNGAEIKSYASAGMVALLLLFIPAYSAIANRVNRTRLITVVTVFFIACLLGFYALAQTRPPFLPVLFFVWVGIFNVMIIAQFWSFANDVYTEEEGRRLFAIVAFGATLGGIFGAAIAKALIEPIGVNQLLLVAAGMLALSIFITLAVDGRDRRSSAAEAKNADEMLVDRRGGFTLVMRDRYLLLIGLLMLSINWVNTNGEYILGKTLSMLADQNVAAGLAGAVPVDQYKEEFIGSFYAGFFTWVNIATAIIQLFFVSRIIKWFGVRAALFVMPIIAFGGYALLAVAPVLRLVRGVKIAENSLDYSLQNTARQALFLPTSREAKYKAKAAIDTFFVRMGDVLSGVLVFIGSSMQLSPKHFAGINAGLALMWLGVLIGVAREHRKRTTVEGSAPAGAQAQPARTG